MFRYDEPQKGRYREFWQADADILGSPYPEADAEIIEIFDKIFEKLGFKNFYIYINDRELIDVVFRFFGISLKDIYTIIDKINKIGVEGVKRELLRKIDEEKVEKIINIISLKGEEAIKEILKINKKEIEKRVNNLYEIIDLSGSKNIVYNPSLVRGLEYYTGMVFEIVVENSNLSLAGGGRYDNLIEMFSKSKVPAVGGSIGVNRLLDFMIDQKLYNLDRKSIVEVAIVYLDQKLYKNALEIARKLRFLGLKVYIDVSRKRFKNQIEYIVSKNIRYIILIGKKELEKMQLTLQDRIEKKRYSIDLKELNKIVEIIKS